MVVGDRDLEGWNEAFICFFFESAHLCPIRWEGRLNISLYGSACAAGVPKRDLQEGQIIATSWRKRPRSAGWTWYVSAIQCESNDSSCGNVDLVSNQIAMATKSYQSSHLMLDRIWNYSRPSQQIRVSWSLSCVQNPTLIDQTRTLLPEFQKWLRVKLNHTRQTTVVHAHKQCRAGFLAHCGHNVVFLAHQMQLIISPNRLNQQFESPCMCIPEKCPSLENLNNFKPAPWQACTKKQRLK